ncbi:uncharacterized protein LOC108743134 [Agrilus planipennis]|uniref:Uncharacterized protein LOC108743134 n=1 Tax=Agrilus planipennis TaxID=224129 RepID=A0A7F5RBZ7_AGRPL|nr:uncharacterized protein LOC108743134 [Agrilus planipennis]
MSPSPGSQQPMSYPLGSNPQSFYVPNVHQGLPTLIVMIVVLMIILLFCFWGAPAVRSFCKRKICCFCPMDEPNMDQGYTTSPATPTIILLPFGRMLVVDRRIFTQLQADYSGIDFMELSANMIRNRHRFEGSSASVLDSESAYKMRSFTSINCFPPSYEDIFGTKNCDLPPSYSEISMMLKTNDKNPPRSANENASVIRNRLLWTSVEVLKKSLHNIHQQTQTNISRNNRFSKSMNDLEILGSRLDRSSSMNTVLNRHFIRGKSSQKPFEIASTEALNTCSTSDCSNNNNHNQNRFPLSPMQNLSNQQETVLEAESHRIEIVEENFIPLGLSPPNDERRNVIVYHNNRRDCSAINIEEITERETCL